MLRVKSRQTIAGEKPAVVPSSPKAVIPQCDANPAVTILALTFKENVPGIRNIKVIDIAGELGRSGISVRIEDTIALSDETAGEYGIALTLFELLRPTDAAIPAVAHRGYVAGGWSPVVDNNTMTLPVEGNDHSSPPRPACLVPGIGRS